MLKDIIPSFETCQKLKDLQFPIPEYPIFCWAYVGNTISAYTAYEIDTDGYASFACIAPTAQELLDQLPVTLEGTGYDLQLLKNQYGYYRAFYTIGWTEIEGDDEEYKNFAQGLAELWIKIKEGGYLDK